MIRSFCALSKTFVNLISSVRFLWLRMHALRNSVILREMFCMRFNRRKKRKKEKKENRRKWIKITSVGNIWKSYIWTAVKDVNIRNLRNPNYYMLIRSFCALSKTFMNLISSVRFLWLRMYALRNSVILRGMFCMRFNRKKRKERK